MFNRELQVKMVKAKKTNPEPVNTIDKSFEENAETVGSIIDSSVKKVGLLVIAYVVVDTARKVLIEMAKS